MVMSKKGITTVSLDISQLNTLREFRIKGRYTSVSEMLRIAVRDFIDRELILEEKIKLYNGEKEIIIIDGKAFKVITK